jgi:hypothetical protein
MVAISKEAAVVAVLQEVHLELTLLETNLVEMEHMDMIVI